MIYKFRVILDAEEDIFRDIAIESDNTLEDLHNAIVNAFGFDGTETGSFFTCEDDWTWNEEDEIPLFDTGEVPGEMKTMVDFKIEDLMHQDNTKMVYVYDFFSMWTFFVELAAIEEEKEASETYPALLFSHGELPAEAGQSGLRGDLSNDDIYGDFEDDFDDDDFDMFDGDDSFEDMGFEENWN
ncbi:hypothetical protein [uncultured Flavobacterium sp.]|uniref:IS1096 element passenger TnpR family protein n=1 Tax=uncultured Flavobacterium sp. TaxID=165435 RepID=UPI0026226AC2|nr:hypothetical protein [uncultured Flavobacterium sp.]